MSADRFLAFVREHPSLPRHKNGKLVLVRAADIDALLAELATQGQDVVIDAPSTEADVLRQLGLKRTG